MGQEILKPWQEQAIVFLASFPEFKNFYLSGGTALAGYYLHHRVSDDLDFFSFTSIDGVFVQKIAAALKQSLNAGEMRFSRLYDRHQFFYTLPVIGEAKIGFTQYPFKQLEVGEIRNNIKIDSEHDIAVNKLAALIDRFDPKDFVDLYFLLPQFSLGELRLAAEKKFGITIDSIFLGGELMKVGRIEALPRMMKPLTLTELKDFFAAEAKKLSREVLDR